MSRDSSSAVALGEVASGAENDSVVVMLHAATWLLRRVRERRGLMLREVAEQCDVSLSVLSRAELSRREARLSLLLQVCNVLGVRFSDVMRVAEDEAFPMTRSPWDDCPAYLLGRPCGSCADPRGCRREGVR